MTPQEDLPDTGTGEETENEVLRAARELQAQKEAAEATEAADKGVAGGKKIGWKTAAAAGIGIGSAAVLAALLYANRGKIK
jgi:hypothetical protein